MTGEHEQLAALAAARRAEGGLSALEAEAGAEAPLHLGARDRERRARREAAHGEEAGEQPAAGHVFYEYPGNKFART